MIQAINQIVEMEPTESQQEVRFCCALDWLEFGGCGQWTGDNASQWVERLEQTKNTAMVTHQDEPLTVAGHILMVSGRGMGSGRQSRMEYVFTWGPVFVGLSDRDSDDPKHQNFYVKIPGDACLRFGESRCIDVVSEIFEEFGFAITDDCIKRADICLDVAGMSLQDQLLPACERGQMKGSLLKVGDRFALHGYPRTGMSLGSRKSIRVNFYDKRHEATQKDERYLAEMIQNRWGGELPEKAMRLEYQIDGAWLRKWGLRSVGTVLERIPDIVKYLTEETGYPQFAILNSVPDRKNKNYSRCETHPTWSRIVQRFRELSGELTQPLSAIDSGTLTAKRAYQTVRGFLTSAAQVIGQPITRFEDGLAVLARLHEINDGTDADWKSRYDQKAKKSGAEEEMMAFPFGERVKPVSEPDDFKEDFDDREIA